MPSSHMSLSLQEAVIGQYTRFPSCGGRSMEGKRTVGERGMYWLIIGFVTLTSPVSVCLL